MRCDPSGLLFAGAFIFLVFSAVISDVTRLTIPNWISAALVALFAAFVVLGDKPLPAFLHVLVALGVLTVGFGIFAAGYVGSGDVKLAAAVALWVGPDKILGFLVWMSLAGAGLAIVIVTGTFYLWSGGGGWIPAWALRLIPRWVRQGLIPYGFAVGVGALLTVPAVIL